MNKAVNTKRALLASALSMILSAAVLIGTTFAWFTDSVTNKGNIIKSGTLDVAMEWADGTEDPDTADWKDASRGAIFNYDLWEPGYSEVRHVRISNIGSLAFKYEIRIIATGEVSELADVIDVYYVPGGQQISDRTGLSDSMKIGTLSEVLAKPYAANGWLAGKNGDTVSADVATVALKMQESAGNEYQGLSIGSEFAVQLTATQYTYEEDGFGSSDYDAAAEYDGDIGSEASLIAAVENGGMYRLTGDIELAQSLSLTQGTEFVLDLNGNGLSFDSGYVFSSEGNLTITGSGTVSGLGAIKSTGGTVIINGGTFNCSSRYQDGTYQHTLKAENSEVIINGGTFDATALRRYFLICVLRTLIAPAALSG